MNPDEPKKWNISVDLSESVSDKSYYDILNAQEYYQDIKDYLDQKRSIESPDKKAYRLLMDLPPTRV